MKRSYYYSSISQFLNESDQHIIGELVLNHEFALEEFQRNAWKSQIQILKSSLKNFPEAFVAFEYAIPRMGKRVDVVLLYQGIVFLLEFKIGENTYHQNAINQVLDYALDLKNFQEQSHNRDIVPIVVATEGTSLIYTINKYPDNIYYPALCNKHNISAIIDLITKENNKKGFIDPEIWINSIYKPTPTIIEAAQALYKGHSVKEISRSDSGAHNLDKTSNEVSNIIKYSKENHRKSICFITGVPGAGKTLAGLNIANERHNIDKGEHAVFLSGNGPLVEVLQEALARNEVFENKSEVTLTKGQSLARTKAFIQNIHHFRDDSLLSEKAPIEKVAVFDEAQRAWTLEQTKSFMLRKKGIPDFNMSEPNFLISVFDRHDDWAVIVCLIGGGQEINTGEAGLPEWFSALQQNYNNWDVYISKRITDIEYTNGKNYFSSLNSIQVTIKDTLHLSVSIRSFRTEKLSEFIKSFLDHNISHARILLNQIINDYPIVITRDLENAKLWLHSKIRGNESMGIIASSGACRLKPYGINIKVDIDPKIWFLNDKCDIRSSGFLEDVATEFEIQGLELDWTCVAWDANLRKYNNRWLYKNFKGTVWQDINDAVRQRYLLNSYRVLLTRARQGMVIFIPEGDTDDQTRLPEFYNPIYQYFLECGVKEI